MLKTLGVVAASRSVVYSRVSSSSCGSSAIAKQSLIRTMMSSCCSPRVCRSSNRSVHSSRPFPSLSPVLRLALAKALSLGPITSSKSPHAAQAATKATNFDLSLNLQVVSAIRQGLGFVEPSSSISHMDVCSATPSRTREALANTLSRRRQSCLGYPPRVDQVDSSEGSLSLSWTASAKSPGLCTIV